MDYMTDKEILYFRAFFLAASCMVAGAGADFFVGTYMAASAKSENFVKFYKLAMFLFPFCTMVGYYARSFLGLPFLVMGIWKFGFPELTWHLVIATDKNRHSLHRWSSALSAVAIILHHGAVFLAWSLVLMTLVPFSRALLIMIQPLIVAHLILPLRYVSATLYAILALITEGWFQFEFFMNWKSIDNTIYKFAIWQMPIAHWLFLIAAGADMFAPPHSTTEEDDDDLCVNVESEGHTNNRQSKRISRASICSVESTMSSVDDLMHDTLRFSRKDTSDRIRDDLKMFFRSSPNEFSSSFQVKDFSDGFRDELDEETNHV